eukprot:5836166-Amphidinium_carterae.1
MPLALDHDAFDGQPHDVAPSRYAARFCQSFVEIMLPTTSAQTRAARADEALSVFLRARLLSGSRGVAGMIGLATTPLVFIGLFKSSWIWHLGFSIQLQDSSTTNLWAQVISSEVDKM